MEREIGAKPAKEDTLRRVRQLLIRKVVSTKGVNFTKTGSGSLNEDWQQAFQAHTGGGSGLLSFEDFQRLVRQCLRISCRSCADDDLQLMFNEVDAAGRGQIEFGQLLDCIHRRERSVERKVHYERALESIMQRLRIALRREAIRCEADVRNLFSEVDVNDDHGVSPHEYRRFMRERVKVSPYEASDSELRLLFVSLDKDKSGELELDDFQAFIVGCIQNIAVQKLPAVCTAYKQRAVGAAAPERALSTSLSSPLLLRRDSSGSASDGDGKALPALSPAGKRGSVSSNSSASPKGGVKLPAMAEDQGAYLHVRGGHRVDQLEKQLFSAGVDVRGCLFRKGGGGGGALGGTQRLKRDKAMAYLQSSIMSSVERP